MNPALDPSAMSTRLSGGTLAVLLHLAGAGVLLALVTPQAPRPLDETVHIEMLTAQTEAPTPPAPQPPAPKPVARPQPVKPQPQAAPVIQTDSPTPVTPSFTAPPPVEHPVAVTAPTPAPRAAQTAPGPSTPVETAQAPRFDADYLHNPAPAYPRASRDLGEEGRVLLRVQVSEDGRALQVLIETPSGFPRLDRAAREAVAQWRFVPARQGQAPIVGWVKVPIVFELKL